MRLRIILAFHMALIYYTQDFRVYAETRDQPMPGPFPAPPIFGGKSPGDEVAPIVGFHLDKNSPNSPCFKVDIETTPCGVR